MRCNQVSISVERFGKYVPESYPADVQRIHVYCDDFKSIYAALSKAYAMAINELGQHERIGVRADVCTNEFSEDRIGSMNGAIVFDKRSYEEDINLEYYDTNYELCKDRIWVYENADAILSALKECDEKTEFSAFIKDKFHLSDYQARKLSQIRFDMMTKAEYDALKDKVKEYEARVAKRNAMELNAKCRKRRLQQEIESIKAYFILVDNYEKVARLTLSVESENEIVDLVANELGIDKAYARNFKYLNLNDLSKQTQQKKREELSLLEDMLHRMDVREE